MASLLAGLPQEVPGETINRLLPPDWRRLCTLLACSTWAMPTWCWLGGGHMTHGHRLSKLQNLLDATWSCMTPASVGGSSIHVLTRFMAQMHGPNRREPRGLAQHQPRGPRCVRLQKSTQGRAAQKEGLGRRDNGLDIPRRKQDPLRFDQDEFIKPQTSLEVLAKLRPAFRKEEGASRRECQWLERRRGFAVGEQD